MTNSGSSPPSGQLALDTSAYSNMRRGHQTVLAWTAAADLLYVSTTVLGELDAGFRLGSRYHENAATLAVYLKEPFVVVQDVTQRIARRYGQLFAALRLAGTPVPTNVIWIAAATIEAGGHLITFDTDFERIDGLQCTVLS